ncbi:MAG: hypothetical protein IJD23_05810 [Spirochaetaceae bacterium]|nr:hypothetical protein [Spirochaetaceae bacterium]
MNLDEQIKEIENVYNIAYKEKCDTCKYQVFSKKLQEMNISQEILNEILNEIKENNDFESNRWTGIFKPAMKYVGSAAIASYISTWVCNTFLSNEDFWVGLIILIFVFSFVYFIFGGIIASIVLGNDLKRNKSKMFIRFLQKYIRERKIEKLSC